MRVTAASARMVLAALALAPPFAVAQTKDNEVVVNKVVMEVKALATWVRTGGALFRLSDEGRTHAADIDSSGKLNQKVKCRQGERFEAAAESYLDRPTPPPRVFCGEELVFKFARAVHSDWVATSAGGRAAFEPYVFSELSTRTMQTGNAEASLAFSDAAIASTAKLLGDEKLDKFVIRDPSQDFKLVFNEAGLDALREWQKDLGLKATGLLDAKTQSQFVKQLPMTSPTSSLTTPAVKCALKSGQLVCASGQLPSSVNATISLPAFEFKKNQ
jgi:hypothetical protein